MAITNATNLRKNLFNYLDAVAINNEKVYITTKKGNAVIISEEYLSSLEETCFLYSIPNMKESILEGFNTSIKDCKKIDWKKL